MGFGLSSLSKTISAKLPTAIGSLGCAITVNGSAKRISINRYFISHKWKADYSHGSSRDYPTVTTDAIQTRCTRAKTGITSITKPATLGRVADFETIKNVYKTKNKRIYMLPPLIHSYKYCMFATVYSTIVHSKFLNTSRWSLLQPVYYNMKPSKYLQVYIPQPRTGIQSQVEFDAQRRFTEVLLK